MDGTELSEQSFCPSVTYAFFARSAESFRNPHPLEMSVILLALRRKRGRRWPRLVYRAAVLLRDDLMHPRERRGFQSLKKKPLCIESTISGTVPSAM